MSTPPGRGEPTGRSVIEPTHVQRRRRSESLAELLRLVREQERVDADGGYESVAVPTAEVTGPVPPARLLPPLEEDETEELPPVPEGEDYTDDTVPAGGHTGPAAGYGRAHPEGRGSRHASGRGAGLRRAAITVAVVAAALIGFALALLVPRADQDDTSRAGGAANSSTAPATSAGAADPDGAGTLREGDSGPEVTVLQRRLLAIPNVYDHGATDGAYDAALTAAVARFQVWYGIRGDESGVYGNDTRADLESRTAAP
ncbi:peptidoglycan-binding protein [Streptomyces sp. NPDC002580]|uniref:peptidoglycan-binding domain-containing protein n=1 Tax=Streptomyces sp. NPDC002580 TaxID=3364653 RepID=UPI0036A50DB4